MRMRIALGAATLCLVTQTAAANAQEVVVTGRLVDGHGAGIALAEVKVNRTRVATNDSGQFAVRIDVGKVNIEAKRLGFMQSKLSLQVRRDTAIEIVMLPSPGQLKAVTVTERARTGLEALGFYDRMEQQKRGLLNGTFITPEDVARRNPSAISQMMGNVQGVALRTSAGRMIPVGPDGTCVMTMFLDGVMVSNTKGQGAVMQEMAEMMQKAATGVPDGRMADYGGIDLVMSAHQLAAMEIYPRISSAPVKYQPLAGSCGVILIWSKDGSEREARRRQ
jgi:hypothetical protein